MAARLGIITQKGLSEVLREEIKSPVLKIMAVVVVISAIVIGNAAYEAGNISGGVLGLSTILPNSSVTLGEININLLNFAIGIFAFIILYIGNYKILERILIVLVVLMSISFVFTAIITKPNLIEIIKGTFIPKLPSNGLLTIIGLIGTTVVPYNLFLHASLVKEKWNRKEDLHYARKDTFIAVIVGGFVSMAIIISAAATNTNSIENAADLAKGLEPLFGNVAKYFMAIGLFAAGITSAITAPLAASFVVKGMMGWKVGMNSFPFRIVWMVILLLGVVFSSLQIKPIEIIKFAQIANGILLPVISVFLLWIMNKKEILGKYSNNLMQNIFGFIILGLTFFLGVKSIWKVIESL